MDFAYRSCEKSILVPPLVYTFECTLLMRNTKDNAYLLYYRIEISYMFLKFLQYWFKFEFSWYVSLRLICCQNCHFLPCFLVQLNSLQTTCMMVDAVLFQLSAFFALFGESSAAAACNPGDLQDLCIFSFRHFQRIYFMNSLIERCFKNNLIKK